MAKLAMPMRQSATAEYWGMAKLAMPTPQSAIYAIPRNINENNFEENIEIEDQFNEEFSFLDFLINQFIRMKNTLSNEKVVFYLGLISSLITILSFIIPSELYKTDPPTQINIQNNADNVNIKIDKKENNKIEIHVENSEK